MFKIFNLTLFSCRFVIDKQFETYKKYPDRVILCTYKLKTYQYYK